jgi:hypothetical protein
MKKHHRRLATLLVIFLPLAGLLVGLLQSPLLRIRQVTIVAPPELGEEVRRQLHLPANASMLFTPLCRISDQVRACYRVEQVSVRRQLPYGLLITVTARQPMAALHDAYGYTLVSREGICLYRSAIRPNLPVFAGLTIPRPALGSRVSADRWCWAMELLAGADLVGLRQGLESDFTEPYRITLQTGAGWSGVLGNVNSLARKMAIMGRVATYLEKRGRQPREIDVTVPESPVYTTA